MYKLIGDESLISIEESFDVIDKIIEGKELKKVLLVPPDITRMPSQTGPITNYAYSKLTSLGVKVDVIPALGSHKPMTESEFSQMFCDIPYSNMVIHDWRNDTIPIGIVPSELVMELTDSILSYDIEVEVNKILYDNYDLIISLGQVVPHEVVGMANYSKNIFVGLGGSNMINKSHYISAICGIENTLGVVDSAVRKVFDYAHDNFLNDLPLVFILTVIADGGIKGVFSSNDRQCFEEACILAKEHNIKYTQKLDIAVCYMAPHEYKTTWLSNKAVYRTCCALKDGGKLYVLAPGVSEFGEDETIDMLIRKYGYVDFDTIIRNANSQEDLMQNQSATAHLLHSSSNGRFEIIYCVEKITKKEIESVNFKYMPYEQAKEMFKDLKYGVTIIDGKNVLYTDQVALELWKEKVD